MRPGETKDRTRVASLDLTDPKNVRKINFGSALIALLFVMLFSILLSMLGHSSYWILLVAVLLIPATVIHEAIHYLFQWLFSGTKPQLGFKFPFPYSAMAPGAEVTRNQGIFCALAPFIFIIPILVLTSLFLSQLFKVLFLAWAALEAATCFGDFFTVVFGNRKGTH